MTAPIQQTITLLSQVLLTSMLLPVIVFLISAPVIMTGSISAMSISVIAVYASLLIISHAIGMRSMLRSSRSIAMLIPTVLVADGAAILAGMNWYGTAIVDMLFKL